MLKMKVANETEVEVINLRPICSVVVELANGHSSKGLVLCQNSRFHDTSHHSSNRKFTRKCFTIIESAECHSNLLKKWGTRSAQGSRRFTLKGYRARC